MNKYDYAFYAGLTLWLIETAAFGYNAEAMSGPEKVLDLLSMIISTYGALGSILTAFSPHVNITLRGQHISSIKTSSEEDEEE